jgi:hypothetical protein
MIHSAMAPAMLLMCAQSTGFAATKIHRPTEGVLMDWAKDGVKIVHSDELGLNTPQTSGMTRAAAITHAGAICPSPAQHQPTLSR